MNDRGPDQQHDMAARRRAAVRTALILAVVAIAIYAWGILSRM